MDHPCEVAAFHVDDAEVQELDGESPIVTGDQHHVRGLDVAVDEVLAVDEIQNLGELRDEAGDEGQALDGGGRSEWRAGDVARQVLREGRAVEVLHVEAGLALLRMERIDPDDPWVLEPLGRDDLLFQTSDRARVRGEVGSEQLDRHDPVVELRIRGLVDHAHAAAAQLLDHPKAAEQQIARAHTSVARAKLVSVGIAGRAILVLGDRGM